MVIRYYLPLSYTEISFSEPYVGENTEKRASAVLCGRYHKPQRPAFAKIISTTFRFF